MSWISDHYNLDKYGNFDSAEEAKKAADADDLVELSNGNYWDKETDTEYWHDGEKK